MRNVSRYKKGRHLRLFKVKWSHKSDDTPIAHEERKIHILKMNEVSVFMEIYQ